MNRIALIAGIILALANTSQAVARDGVVFESPELVVVRHGSSESCILPGSSYSNFKVEGTQASFLIEDLELAKGTKSLRGGGIKKVSWEPAEGGGTFVRLEFAGEPLSALINFMPGTEVRPGMPQVLAGFSFDSSLFSKRAQSVLGSRKRSTDLVAYGNYELPQFPDYKYSDVLVTLEVRNVDFREVLWLLSSISGVSIVLDPYWDDEPTGSRRQVGGGAEGPGGSGEGGGGPGFRSGGDFYPQSPREGTGNLSLNFHDVPFDTALDLILMSVGLVKVDIWPDS